MTSENGPLAASLFKFRRLTQDAIDTLTINMIQHDLAVNGIRFKTPNGRPCLIVMAFSDDEIAALAGQVIDRGFMVENTVNGR